MASSYKLVYYALMKNGTSPLFHLLLTRKQVYHVKKLTDSTIERRKTRQLVKVFNQQHGIDYGDTINPCTINIIFTLALSYHWNIRQLDVDQNALFNSILTDEVYEK